MYVPYISICCDWHRNLCVQTGHYKWQIIKSETDDYGHIITKQSINMHILFYLLYSHRVLTEVQAFMNLVKCQGNRFRYPYEFSVKLYKLQNKCKKLRWRASVPTISILAGIGPMESIEARGYNLQRRHPFTFYL